jgi:nicotinamidase-related amidase
MNKALLVIDVQEDIIGENRCKKRFSYKNPELLIQNINNSIEDYRQKGYVIIYIAEVFPKMLLSKLFVRRLIRGTEGVKLVKGLNIVSDNYFEKIKSSAFSNKKLCQFIYEKHIDKVVLCGFDGALCVAATAKAAHKLGFKVNIIKNSVDAFNDNRAEKVKVKFKKLGIKYI